MEQDDNDKFACRRNRASHSFNQLQKIRAKANWPKDKSILLIDKWTAVRLVGA